MTDWVAVSMALILAAFVMAFGYYLESALGVYPAHHVLLSALVATQVTCPDRRRGPRRA